MRNPVPVVTTLVSGLVFAAAMALAAAPARTQPTTVEGLVVIAKPPPGEQKQVFSYKVGYADIDLRTELGKTELKRRIEVTVKYVCRRLADTDHKPNTYGDCRRNALTNVGPGVDAAIAAAESRPGPFKTGPSWQPPPGASR